MPHLGFSAALASHQALPVIRITGQATPAVQFAVRPRMGGS